MVNESHAWRSVFVQDGLHLANALPTLTCLIPLCLLGFALVPHPPAMPWIALCSPLV